MAHIWWQRYDIDVVSTTGSQRVRFPRLRDVATREDAGFSTAWMAGEDGSLWHHGRGLPPSSAGQVPSPGGMVRLAVALDGAVWAVTVGGGLWHRTTAGAWSRITIPAGIEPIVDVAVHQGTVWVVRDDGAMWQTRDGVTFEERTILIGMKRLAGLNNGDLWGLSTHQRPMLTRRRLDGSSWDLPQSAHDKTWVDISVSTEGVVWLVASDGTVWTTTDGTGFLSIAGGDFVAVAAGGFEIAWAVKRDGTLWVWHPEPTAPPPPPPPPPPPTPPPAQPPPSAVRPQIGVSTSGAGGGTVFHVSGSGFLGNVDVTVRGARIGPDGVFDFYWLTRSAADGSMSVDLPIPCLSGVTIHFSANDGRPDATDLTNRFWSNTVPRSCP